MDADETWRAPPPPQPRHEPVFVLKASDLFAATALELWLELSGLRFGDQAPQVLAARRRLNEMRAWAADRPAEPPA